MGTYTTKLNLYKPSVGESGWGTLVNENFDKIDAASSVIGAVQLYAGSTAPSGWLICNGQAVSRTTYAALFSVIGTTYGAGDSSTTFNMPNLQGRVPIGVSASHALGTTGGEETHTLTIDEMPSHNHGLWISQSSNSGSFHTSLTGTNTGNRYSTQMTTAVIEYTGANGTHNNMQPYITLNYIIRAL